MTMRRSPTLLALAALVALIVMSAGSAGAAEICGNGVDDDANGMADEGCMPAQTTGVCESPLDCGLNGAVAPLTGSLTYQLPAADLAPVVPYGPGISFSRFYTSAYAPGSSAPAYRKPLGEHWQHPYMSWLDKNTRTFSQVDVLAGSKTVLALLVALSILPLYLFHLRVVLPLVERLFLRGAQDFAMIGTYSTNFGDAAQFAEMLRTEGLETELRRYFFGCATGVCGRKPPITASAPIPPPSSGGARSSRRTGPW